MIAYAAGDSFKPGFPSRSIKGTAAAVGGQIERGAKRVTHTIDARRNYLLEEPVSPLRKIVGSQGAHGLASQRFREMRTPVPGGVGPMTVSMLLINTVTSCERWLRHMSIPIVKEFATVQAASR